MGSWEELQGGGSGGTLPAGAPVVVVALAQLRSQSVWVKPGSGSVAKYELPDLTLALYNCCLAEYIWDVSRTRGECDFACFSQDLNLAELIRKTQRSHCAKPVSELALLPGESHKVKVRGEEGLRECCGGRCWNTLGDLRSDTE